MFPIPLTNSDKVAFVDEDLAPQVLSFAWQLGTHGYASHSGKTLMHRFVYELRAQQSLNTFPGTVVIEHLDHNKLNNRNDNLRLTSQGVNMFRSKGVSVHTQRDSSKGTTYVYYILRMTWHYKPITILTFKEESAARAAQPYIKAELLNYLESNPFADRATILNFIRSKREEWKNDLRR